MDREPEELQFLGAIGMYNEACKILWSWRKLFSQITLVLILPLSLVFLAHIKISDLIFSDIDADVDALEIVPADTPLHHRLLRRLSSAWISFLLFKAAYLLVVLILSLLCTSAVVFSIASIYTSKPPTLTTTLSAVPLAWKRLLITFSAAFLLLFSYNSVAVLLLLSLLFLSSSFPPALLLATLLLLLYLVGFVYLSVVWHLASVFSVLEDSHGLSAMRRCRSLLRGKALPASIAFLTINTSLFAIHLLFAALVVHPNSPRPNSSAALLALALILLLAQAAVILFGLVVQTVVYFVCKAYHHESIDKTCLAEHLGGYLGEYVPLTGKAVQLESLSSSTV